MTKRLAGRLASHRCECSAAANDTEDISAAGDASEEATQPTVGASHVPPAAMPWPGRQQ